MPTFPFESITKAVEVAEAVEVETKTSGKFERVAVEVAATERSA